MAKQEPGSAARDGSGIARRRELGAFYTPEHAVEHMVSMLELGPDSRVLEPSGGDGAFVHGLLAAGVVPEQITVWDINPEAVGGLSREVEGLSVEVRDTLLSDLSGARFTHVVGNPPYLSKASEYVRSRRAQLRKRWGGIATSETYAMFVLAGLEVLEEGGQLVLLLSDTFLTLGTHRKLREHLLEHTQVEELVLLGKGVFPGASVSTVMLSVRKGAGLAEGVVRVRDCRGRVGEYEQKAEEIALSEWRESPASVWVIDAGERRLLERAARMPRLMDSCEGGLGMFTGDNERYLGLISRGSGASARAGERTVAEAEVDGKSWRLYHKRGGNTRWWALAEHCVRWDEKSQAAYTMPESSQVGESAESEGVLVSGVASRLSARLASPGAAWESNKAFCLFPRTGAQLSSLELLALLNSSTYARLAAAGNHTVSLQMRDLRALPLPERSPEVRERLRALGRAAVEAQKRGESPADAELAIDEIVAALFE